ncbi:MAG: hypothetical protein OXQ89_09000 [Rhodospirillaceae bacterium]|nr:hypothetical protein [Rhodospirillaceae bacterium]
MARIALAACLILAVVSPLWGEADNPGLGIHGVGSYWTYTVSNGATITSEIIDRIEHRGREMLMMAIDNSSVATRPGETCHGADADLLDVETGSYVACLKDGRVLGEIIPHDGRFSFPMAVGNTWSAVTFWEDNVNPDWSSGPFFRTWEVVAYESVTVPAGTYMAFRIDYLVEGSDLSIWYAPVEKFPVKQIYRGDVYELSDYSVTEHIPELEAIRARISILEAEIAAIKSGLKGIR